MTSQHTRIIISILTLTTGFFSVQAAQELPKKYPSDEEIIAWHQSNAGQFVDHSASNGMTDRMQRSIDSGISVNVQSPVGATALMRAAHNGHIKALELLIRHGANVNAHDIAGNTVLMCAGAHKQAVRILLQHGAHVTIDARNYWGRTALINTARDCRSEERESHDDPEHWDRIGIAELLLHYGADVNARDNEGFTALMYAAQKAGHRKLIAVLLQAQARIDSKNNSGNTALMLAAQAGHTEAVRALLAAGADPFILNNNNQTALTCAQQHQPNNNALIELLENEQARRALVHNTLNETLPRELLNIINIYAITPHVVATTPASTSETQKIK